ncbi:MAG: hypothetical protein QW203_06745 [Thermoplasmatales archaeon]
MKPVDCPSYGSCECPLCPLDDSHAAVWYSDDDICRNPDFKVVSKTMRKLKRKGAEGYFTLAMLNREFIIRKGIKGIDPDLPDTVKDPEKEYQRREKLWLKKHPEISEVRKMEMKERLKTLKSIQNTPSTGADFEVSRSERVINRLDINISKNPPIESTFWKKEMMD